MMISQTEDDELISDSGRPLPVLTGTEFEYAFTSIADFPKKW